MVPNLHSAQPSGSNPRSTTPLHIAAKNGQADEVTKLLSQKNVDFNSVDEAENQPLHYAVEIDRLDIVQSLVRAGADLGKKGKDGNTPIEIADKLEEEWDRAGVFAKQDAYANICRYFSLVEGKNTNFPHLFPPYKTPNRSV